MQRWNTIIHLGALCQLCLILCEQADIITRLFKDHLYYRGGIFTATSIVDLPLVTGVHIKPLTFLLHILCILLQRVPFREYVDMQTLRFELTYPPVLLTTQPANVTDLEKTKNSLASFALIYFS